MLAKKPWPDLGFWWKSGTRGQGYEGEMTPQFDHFKIHAILLTGGQPVEAVVIWQSSMSVQSKGHV